MIVERPLCLFCVMLISGILLCSFTGLSFFLIIVAAQILLIILLFHKVEQSVYLILSACVFFAAGGLILSNAERMYYDAFEEYYGKAVTVKGYIDDEAEVDDDGKVKFILKTERIKCNGVIDDVSGRLLVYMNSAQMNDLKYRTEIEFSSVIEQPKSATNPGGFNYRRYLATIGVSGTVYLGNHSTIRTDGIKSGGLIKKSGCYIKNKILNIIEYCLEENQAGLLSGMLIGYKNGLGEYAYQAFSKAGLTHIMVASGMNVAFIILPVTFILKKLRLNAVIANITTMGVLVLFLFVTGFSASVARAVIMGIIILAGRIVMRETDIYTSISAAAIILLFFNPFIIYDIGFQLSFAATISLVLFYPKLKEIFSGRLIPDLVSDTLAATMAAQVGVVPVTLYYFNNLSTISIVSNLLVVPLVQIITIIGFIMVFAAMVNINLAVLVGYINNTFLSFVLFITEYTSKIPFSSVKLPTPPLGLIILYYLILIYIFKGRGTLKNFSCVRYFKIAVPVILVIILLANNLIIPKPLKITFIDVGEGDCAFIKTAEGVKALIDGGGRAANSKSKFDIGESVVVPYILDLGTKKVDIVIATHGHRDHTEGLEAVLRELTVGTVIIPDTDGEGFEKIKEICKDKKINIIKCKFGDKIKLDNETSFDVLNPLPFEQDVLAQQSLNESSLVLKLIYREVSFLFTGDSGIPVEQRMIEQSLNLNADLIKIGHHGSYGSSSEEFIDSVKPDYAVISLGTNNNFGHPSPSVTDRLNENGIEFFRTDECGAVMVKSYGSRLEIKTMLPGMRNR